MQSLIEAIIENGGEHWVEKKSHSHDSGVEGIGKKVPYCVECKTADFDDDTILVEVVDGKEKKMCPFCHDPLRMWSEERISNANQAVGTPIGDFKSLPSYVTRTMTTPYGRLRITMSNQSMQVYNAQFANAQGEFAKPTRIDQEFWYPAMDRASAIKAVINTEFSSAQKLLAFGKLGGTILEFTLFMDRLKKMVDAVMAQGYSAPQQLDFDTEVLH